jgi:ketopantoate reductase
MSVRLALAQLGCVPRTGPVKTVAIVGGGPVCFAYLLPALKTNNIRVNVVSKFTRPDLVKVGGIRNNGLYVPTIYQSFSDMALHESIPAAVIWTCQNQDNMKGIANFDSVFGSNMPVIHVSAQNGIDSARDLKPYASTLFEMALYIGATREGYDKFVLNGDNGAHVFPVGTSSTLSDAKALADFFNRIGLNDVSAVSGDEGRILKVLKTVKNLNNYLAVLGYNRDICEGLQYGHIDRSDSLKELRVKAATEFYQVYKDVFDAGKLSFEDVLKGCEAYTVALKDHIPTHGAKVGTLQSMEDLLGPVIATAKEKGIEVPTLELLHSQVYVAHQARIS